MQAWIILSILGSFVFSSVALAAESRQFTKVDTERAVVKIVTDEGQGVQAAVFVDGEENEKFMKMLLEEPNSRLASLRDELEKENCDPSAQRYDSWIEDCGSVEFTDPVQTSFARGGWMSAGAQYTYFVGFRHAGTGHIFEATYMVVIQEEVNAEMNQQNGTPSVLKKDLSLVRIVRMPGQIRILPIR